MKRGQIVLLIMNIVLIGLTLLNVFFRFLDEWVLTIFLGIILFTLIKYFGFERTKKYYQKYILIIVLMAWFIYTIISYFLGLTILGFTISPLSSVFQKVVIRTVPIFLIIVFSELIRYILVTKGRKYKDILIITAFTFILVDVTVFIGNFNFHDSKMVLEFILLIMTLISKNIFLTYVSYKTDYRIPIIYRLLMELPIYVFSRFPNLGEYVDTVIKFLLPIVLAFLTYRNLKVKTIEKPKEKSKTKRTISYILLAVFIVFFVGITCGWFRYYTLAVGSGSMSPNIKKGDIIVVEKIKNKKEELKIGDVLVFQYNDTIIVHRIIKIENGYFYTKGDANTDPDDYPIPEGDVLGKAVLRMPVVGKPIIWLNELLEKSK